MVEIAELRYQHHGEILKKNQKLKKQALRYKLIIAFSV